MSMVPFTAAPLWVSVSDTGTNTPPVPALPVHVPARLAVGALSSAFSARQAAHPAARTLSRARSTIVGVFIMVSSRRLGHIVASRRSSRCTGRSTAVDRPATHTGTRSTRRDGARHVSSSCCRLPRCSDDDAPAHASRLILFRQERERARWPDVHIPAQTSPVVLRLVRQPPRNRREWRFVRGRALPTLAMARGDSND